MTKIYAKPDIELRDHCIDVGVIAEALLTSGRASHALNNLAEKFDVNSKDLIDSICFLCAAHDIGKAHPGFQKMLFSKSLLTGDSLSELRIEGLVVDKDTPVRHERYSRELVIAFLASKGFNESLISDLALILAYHHQGKQSDTKIKQPVTKFNYGHPRWREWKLMQDDILEELYMFWPFSKSVQDLVGQSGINGLADFILSVMVISDWIASGEQWQTFSEGTLVDKAALQFMKDNELDFVSLGERFKDIRWKKVFDFSPNELQSVTLNDNLVDVKFMLIEYPCGCGKTEAALTAAVRMAPDCSGIYFAAPTTATAKSLAKRCKTIAEKAGLSDLTIPEFDSSMLWSLEDMSKIPQELWVSKSRHQLLYPFSVGTIDQALKAVLKHRYSCIGLTGLSDKVVIVDEVHAYDAYMLTELETLISWCRFFNVPVILLSATLPNTTKNRLFRAAGVQDPSFDRDQYPLLSYVRNREIVETCLKGTPSVVSINSVRSDNLQDTMLEFAKNVGDGCSAFILPTVDSAFKFYNKVKEIADCDVLLYQGRATITQKTEKCQELLRLLGKDRKHRPDKIIVVATSIIEQSLDIDFDRMFTALAPVDLLIQRLGRVWRHSDIGTIREREKIDNPFTVVIPKTYASLGFIYDDNILQATEDALRDRNKIDLINDVRGLIDSVYSSPLDGDKISEINAGRYCFGSPFADELVDIGDTLEYQAYDNILPQTRESVYSTVQIAILPELKEDYTYNEVREIMLNNVVSVGASRIKDFESVKTDIKWFNDIKVFVSPDLTIRCNNKEMKLSNEGLEFL